MSDQNKRTETSAHVKEQIRNVQVVKNQAKLTAAIEAAKKARSGTPKSTSAQPMKK